MRTLRPSDHPSLSSPSRNAATRSFISGWSSARLASTTTRRARRERPCSRTAEQRDEQQPSGWSGERYVHSHQIFAADGGASWQDNYKQRRCWNWLSELSVSAYRLDVLLGERHPLLAAEQLQQNLHPLPRLHVGIDRQMIAEGTM